jgi:hypothetical protein
MGAVAGDRSATAVGVQLSRSRIQKFAEHLRRNPTPAERELTRILNTVVAVSFATPSHVGA